MNVPDLHCHSTYSMLDGMGTPEDVVKRAVELGWGAVCLTEHGWMGSAPDLYKAAIAYKIKPILGCELYTIPSREQMKDKAFHLTVLALNKEGYFNLVAWNSFASRRENYHRVGRISVEEMIEHAPHSLRHNVVLSGCLGSELAATFFALRGSGSDNGSAATDGGQLSLVAGAAWVESMRSAFPHVYLEFQSHAHRKHLGRGRTGYENLVADEKAYAEWLQLLAEITGCPVVVTNDSHFQSAAQRKSHLAMQATSWRNKAEGSYGERSQEV